MVPCSESLYLEVPAAVYVLDILVFQVIKKMRSEKWPLDGIFVIFFFFILIISIVYVKYSDAAISSM